MLGGNEYYKLNLNAETFRVMAGFGGGMATGELCGALSGGVALLGVLFTPERGYDDGKVKEATKDFVESFRAQLSSDNCEVLKDLFREEEIKCIPVVEKGAEILEKIINKYQR